MKARTWCDMHYARFRKHGHPLGGRHYILDPEERFLARTERRGECLIWTGTRNPEGYGYMAVRGETVGAHRYAWEREHGPIPDGMVIDHRYHCDKACCEVSHLREATNAQNVRHTNGPSSRSKTGIRGVSPRRGGFIVKVTVGGERRGGWHRDIASAAAEAEYLTSLRGDFGGNIRKAASNLKQ